MRNTIYFNMKSLIIYFNMKSLRDDPKKDYRDMSINQQKDWYISYLESKVWKEIKVFN